MAIDLFTWNDDFLVHNRNLDRQHRELVKTANEFYAACQSGSGPTKAQFLKMFQGAVNYAKSHFSDEEEVMRKAAYPDIEAHQKEHRDFAVNIMEQVRIFENAENPDPAGLVKMLGDWVHNHVVTTDSKYIPYITGIN